MTFKTIIGAFCNTFDLHYSIIGLEKQYLVFLRVAVLDRFYCTTYPSIVPVSETVVKVQCVTGALDIFNVD